MAAIGWLVKEDGFQKCDVLEATDSYRKIKFIGGENDGQEAVVPPDGIANGDFYPSLYVQDGLPEVWRFKGRSLPMVKASSFKHPDHVKALIPESEPYTFLPHTIQVIDGILSGDHQLLFGPTGVGKTSLILQIAARIGQPVIRLNFNGQIAVSDLVGSVGFGKDGTIWNDGALPRAMRNGYWLLCDEFDFGDPSVLSIFYPVLEASPKLCLKEHDGEMIEAHPGFLVFATGNSINGSDRDGEYVGTQPLNAALLNRFSGHGSVINIKPMSHKQEREVLKRRLPQMPPRLIRRACDMAARLRHGDGQNAALIPTFSTRELINFSTKMLLYRDAITAARITFLPLVKNEQTKKGVEDAIRLLFGRRIILGRGIMPTSASAAPAGLVPAVSTPGVGRVSSEISDRAEMKAIFEAYKGNGGGLSYEQIEKDSRFNLRASSGMNAYRVVKKYADLLKRDKDKAEKEKAKAESPKDEKAEGAKKAAPADEDEEEEEEEEEEEDEEDEA